MNIELDLSVCIVTRNRPDIIKRFLASLHETADPVAFEAIVVDNHSTDGTADMIAAQFPNVLLYENSRQEPVVMAGNRAMRIAGGRYISLWDDDIIIQAESLHRIIRFMDAHPDIGIAGPRIINANGAVQPSTRMWPTFFSMLFLHTAVGRIFPDFPLLNKHLMLNWDHLTTDEVDWLAGSCLFIRREVVEEIGMPDEEFISSYEDADYCLRARRAGWHIHYLHDAVIVHDQPARYFPCHAPHTPKPNLLGDISRFMLKKWLRPTFP